MFNKVTDDKSDKNTQINAEQVTAVTSNEHTDNAADETTVKLRPGIDASRPEAEAAQPEAGEDGAEPVEDPKNDAASEDAGNTPKKEKIPKKLRYRILKIVLVLALIVAVLAGLMSYAFTRAVDSLNMQRIDSKVFGDELYVDSRVSSNENMRNYTNIALFGVDSRQDDLLGGDSRSDVIIVASINNRTGRVKLCSVYRDSYINIGYGKYNKANTAYAYGGPAQAVNMLNMNLDLNITDFVTIGFKGIIDVIDAVGGVDIEVTEEEIPYINMYLSTMEAEIGSENTPLAKPGYQHLNGAQATAYTRIRYTQGGDFKRTERQKTVLRQIFANAKKMSPSKLVEISNAISDEVATSLSNTELAGILMRLLILQIDETSGFPSEQTRTPVMLSGRSVILPTDLIASVKQLHLFLFGEEDYQTSELVNEISAVIDRRAKNAIVDDDPMLTEEDVVDEEELSASDSTESAAESSTESSEEAATTEVSE